MGGLLTLLVAACTASGPPSETGRTAAVPEDTVISRPPIEQVQERNTPMLMSIPGVVGTAIGEQRGLPCILVFVKAKDDSLEARIPAVLEGYPVTIEEVGEIRPLTP